MADAIQQQLIAARKNQILDAAAVVFADKGFHPTTIKDIAKRAGIADGTIYNYFESKTALLLAIFERMKASVIQDNPPPVLTAPDTRTFIRNFVALPFIAMQQDNFALFRVIVSEMMVNEELRVLYYQQILAPALHIAENYFSIQLSIPEVKIRLVVRVISGMMLGLMIEHILGDEILARHWEQLPDLITDLLLNGIKEMIP